MSNNPIFLSQSNRLITDEQLINLLPKFDAFVSNIIDIKQSIINPSSVSTLDEINKFKLIIDLIQVYDNPNLAISFSQYIKKYKKRNKAMKREKDQQNKYKIMMNKLKKECILNNDSDNND